MKKLFFFSLILASCSETYVIPKNDHYSNGFHFGLTNLAKDSSFDFSLRFLKAKYKTMSRHNQFDINKVMGFSDCFSPHHLNSIRLGWRYCNVTGAIHLFSYAYTDGQRSNDYIESIAIGETVKASIHVGENYNVCIYRFGTVTCSTLPRKCKGRAVGYDLFPYFGGDEAAPEEIIMEIIK